MYLNAYSGEVEHLILQRITEWAF